MRNVFLVDCFICWRTLEGKTQQEQVHGLRSVVLQTRLLLAATRRRQPKLPVLGGGGAEQVLYKEPFRGVVARGLRVVWRWLGSGYASLAMALFFRCTRFEPLLPCSLILLSAVTLFAKCVKVKIAHV